MDDTILSIISFMLDCIIKSGIEDNPKKEITKYITLLSIVTAEKKWDIIQY